jgi:hypothetical protein
MSDTPKVDFGKLLDELKAAGCSLYRVAWELDRDWDTVNGWRHHEPRHSDGEALIALHDLICGENRHTEKPL